MRSIDLNLVTSAVHKQLKQPFFFPIQHSTFSLSGHFCSMVTSLDMLGSVQLSSVPHLCLILCDTLDWSTPGLPVHHQLPELAQTHVHGVSDAIQPSHPLLSSSPPAFNLSQHQGLFQRVSSSHQVAKIRYS